MGMDVLKVLRKEESKLLTVVGKAETKLSQIRAAIQICTTSIGSR